MAKPKKDKSGGSVAKGCIECGQRYEDRWDPPEELGLCQTCKRGHNKMESELAQFPRDCCLLNARPVTRDERRRMRLGGPPEMTWYICDGDTGKCHRTFPFANPGTVPWVWDRGEPTDKEKEREARRRASLR